MKKANINFNTLKKLFGAYTSRYGKGITAYTEDFLTDCEIPFLRVSFPLDKDMYFPKGKNYYYYVHLTDCIVVIPDDFKHFGSFTIMEKIQQVQSYEIKDLRLQKQKNEQSLISIDLSLTESGSNDIITQKKKEAELLYEEVERIQHILDTIEKQPSLYPNDVVPSLQIKKAFSSTFYLPYVKKKVNNDLIPNMIKTRNLDPNEFSLTLLSIHFEVEENKNKKDLYSFNGTFKLINAKSNQAVVSDVFLGSFPL